MINITVTIPGGSLGAVGTDPEIDLTGDYNGGTMLDGSRYVIAPAGIKIAGSTPAPGTVDGRAGHGMMINPQQADTPDHGLDAGIAGYSAGLLLGADTIVPVGSAIVKVKSSDPRVNSGREGLFAETTLLHIVASAPASGVILPAIWPSDDLANKPYRAVNVDNFLADLPVYASSGAPSWADLAQWFDRIDLGRAMAMNINYQYLTPYFISGLNSAYDENRAKLVGAVWAGVLGTEWSTSDKTAAMIRLLSQGCQITEAYAAFGNSIYVDGGHGQSHLAACLAWIKATGQTGDYAAHIARLGGHLTGQYYQVTSGMFDPHDSADLPYVARRRTVLAITGSGPYQVTCTDYRPGSGLTGDTASNADFRGRNLLRESNGATALITAQSDAAASPGTGWTFTVDTLPSGLTTTHTVLTSDVAPLSVGQWDFTPRPAATYPNLPNPGPYAEYRGNNKHGNNLLPISAMGMRGSDFTGCKAYLERVSESVSYGTLESGVVTGGVNSFAQTFFAANQAAMLAVTQDV